MGKSKNKNKKRKGGGGGSGGEQQPNIIAICKDVETNILEIDKSADPSTAGPLWGQIHKLLIKAKADSSTVIAIVTQRDVDGLQKLLRHLRGEESAEDAASETASPQAVGSSSSDPEVEVPAETLKKALRAFRKRLKLTRLDHESRLGVGPLSGGKKADLDAIMAPYEFPKDVWVALVARGDLLDVGRGFYQLPEDA